MSAFEPSRENSLQDDLLRFTERERTHNNTLFQTPDIYIAGDSGEQNISIIEGRISPHIKLSSE